MVSERDLTLDVIWPIKNTETELLVYGLFIPACGGLLHSCQLAGEFKRLMLNSVSRLIDTVVNHLFPCLRGLLEWTGNTQEWFKELLFINL